MTVFASSPASQQFVQQGQPYQGLGQPFTGQSYTASAGIGQGPSSQLPVLVTDLSLRCATTALGTVIEQLRVDPQALWQIQAQGQIPQIAWSGILTECARRIAPSVHGLLVQMGGPVQAPAYGQAPSFMGQVPAHLPYPHQPLT